MIFPDPTDYKHPAQGLCRGYPESSMARQWFPADRRRLDPDVGQSGKSFHFGA